MLSHRIEPGSPCCGHSQSEDSGGYTRLKCRACGLVVNAEETAETGGARTHGQACGPVEQEVAHSHAEFVEWLFEASRAKAH
jgi:hypothetical protein